VGVDLIGVFRVWVWIVNNEFTSFWNNWFGNGFGSDLSGPTRSILVGCTHSCARSNCMTCSCFQTWFVDVLFSALKLRLNPLTEFASTGLLIAACVLLVFDALFNDFC
jgi:hypothetical protein